MDTRYYFFKIYFYLFSFLNAILAVFSTVIYFDMKNYDDTSKLKDHLLAYAIAQTVCTVLTCPHICIDITTFCCEKKENIELVLTLFKYMLYIIIASICVLSMVFAGLISFEFFVYNYNASFEYPKQMSIFVGLLLNTHFFLWFIFIMFQVLFVGMAFMKKYNLSKNQDKKNMSNDICNSGNS